MQAMSETKRLEQLRSYDILDTPPEEEFDAITRLAAKICETPVAMINFIDENRQWTKSAVGFKAKEVLRENAICSRTIQEKQKLVIANLSKDQRFCDHPMVDSSPNFRFYAGINIQSPNEYNLGTLCVLDKKERNISKSQKENLEYLADEISTRLELRRKRRRLKEQNITLQGQSQFLKNATDLLFNIDSQTGAITESHSGNQSVIGFSSDELTGRSIFELLDIAEVEKKFRRWMLDENANDSFQQEALIKTKSSKKLWCKLNATKQNERIYLTGRDISEKHKARKRLMAESEMNQKLIQNLPGIFCLINQDGNIINWNNNFVKKGNYTEKALKSKTHYKNYFKISDGSNNIEEILTDIFDEGKVRTECSLKTGDGGLVPILFTGFRIDYTDDEQAVAIAIDQSNQKEAENKLAGEKLRFELATKAASDVIWDRDFDQEKIWWSEGLHSQFGYERDPKKYGVAWWKSKVHPEDREELIAELDQFFESDKTFWSDSYRFEKSDGSYAFVRESIYIIRDDQKHPCRLIGAIVDETDRVEAQKDLQNAIDSLNKAHEIAELGYYEWKPEEDILEWSDRVLDIYGIDKDARPFSIDDYKALVHPEDMDKVEQLIGKITNGESVNNLVHRVITPAGKTKYIEQRVNVITDDLGNVKLISGTAQDITEQKQYENQLQKSLNRNRVLLSEIHHRVKNNMAIISGLLELEAMKTTDEDLRTKMKKSQMRIQSMAMVHEKLYQSDDFSNLSFAKYVTQLVESIETTYGLEEKGIALKTIIEPIEMNINQAISCGLLIHELLTNIVKHGFKVANNENSTIAIQISAAKSIANISILDNGNGLPDGFSLAEKESLGITLIKTLIRQLNADLDVSSDEVTEFDITFELDKELQGSASNADLSNQ